MYIDENEEMCLIPTSWTNVLEEDPFITISDGRSHFRFSDLKELSDMIKDIKETR